MLELIYILGVMKIINSLKSVFHHERAKKEDPKFKETKEKYIENLRQLTIKNIKANEHFKNQRFATMSFVSGASLYKKVDHHDNQ